MRSSSAPSSGRPPPSALRCSLPSSAFEPVILAQTTSYDALRAEPLEVSLVNAQLSEYPLRVLAQNWGRVGRPVKFVEMDGCIDKPKGAPQHMINVENHVPMNDLWIC